MSRPTVEIVVPVYNDPEGIQTTLESLLTQTTTNHQVVVVDNDSTDCTPEIVHSYEEDHDHLTLEHETEIQSPTPLATPASDTPTATSSRLSAPT